MNTQRILLLLLASAALLASTSPAPSLAAEREEKPYVTLAYTEYEIDNRKDVETVRLAVTLADDVSAVEARLADVAYGKRHDQSLAEAFGVKMKPASEGSPLAPAIVIEVKTAGLQQGTYHLLIEVWPVAASPPAGTPPQGNASRSAPKTAPARKAKPQLLKVQVSLPAATLRPTGTFAIEQIRPLFGETFSRPAELALTETSGKRTRLTDVSVTQVDKVVPEDGETSEKVEFTPVTSIDPTKTGHATVKLSGPFPLGTNRGTAQVTSAQLEAPVMFSFEVKTRRSRAYIVAAILFGLLAGFGTRVWAAQRIEREEARLKAIPVAKTLERELARRPDAGLQGRLTKPLSDLRTAIEKGSAAAINAAAAEANEKLTAALADLDLRRDAASADLQKLRELAGRAELLPPDVAPSFAVEARVLDEAARLIKFDNVAGARQAIDAAAEQLGRGVGPVVSAWRANSKSFLAQVGALAAVLPSSAAGGIGDEATARANGLDELTLPDEDADPAALASASDSLRDSRLKIGELVLRVRGLLGLSAETLRAQFGQVIDALPGPVEKVVAGLGRIQQNLLAWADRPESGAKELNAALVDLKGMWREALLGQIKSNDAEANDAARTAVQQLLDDGKFLDASQKVVEFLRDHPPKKDNVLGEGGAAPRARRAAALAADDSLPAWMGGLAAGQAAPLTINERTIPPSLDLLELTSMRSLLLTKGARFAIAGFFIIIIGYTLFVDKFVGTMADLLAVFIWAFGVDISVETVLEAGKKLKPLKSVA